MVDFLRISTRNIKQGVVEIYPKFVVGKRSDLMIKGGDFYAVWLEEKGFWSKNEDDVIELVDRELDAFAREYREHSPDMVIVQHMWDGSTGMIDSWHKYCQKQQRDSFHLLDEELIFAGTAPSKEDYASMTLPYPLEEGPIDAYDKLMSTLYSPEERHKIEWAIGSIVSGESKKIQKFLVLYGEAGTGKSTVLNIIQQLFEGYYCVFDAKALGSASNQFALEAFRSNPLVAIQHDGDLSRIEDNTRLNSVVSHETMMVNEKFKQSYPSTFKCFLFMGTNKPVKITDAKSGLIRRLIDVTPTGDKLQANEYKSAVRKIKFELGAIAYHCQEVYMENPGYYDRYIPISMLNASNDFYNFISDSYMIFLRDGGVSLKSAWEMYKTYVEDAKVAYPYARRAFQEELKNYFSEYHDRYTLPDGTRIRSYYKGFREDKFEQGDVQEPEKESDYHRNGWIEFSKMESKFDISCSDCLAQYANENGTPKQSWDKVTKTLQALDTSHLHYVKVPENHIVIDFDIKDSSGKKNRLLNLEEANKWPKTYVELSKSGEGVHLHYIYTGDPSKLSRVYDDSIEIKVFTGNSSLRRKLTLCNDLPIAKISSGLPMKGETKMVDFGAVITEKGIRTMIKRNLRKEIHPGTKPSIDFIYKILEDAYNAGTHYDVSDMHNAVLAFAINSTHQSDYCIKLVEKMKFKSDDPSDNIDFDEDSPIVFFDCEVFPNLFIVNWKVRGEGKPVVRMINPSPSDIEDLMKYRLVGFNCRHYDNHMLYARLIGYTNEQLFELSNHIVSKNKKDTRGHRTQNNCFFSEAYNLSYTDIYDFASAGHKMSLKKLEIEMGIHHQELGLPWDEPVPKELWVKVAEYCDNDVLATEAAFDYLKSDWTARQILADWAGMSVNDTTNTLTAKIIFGNDRQPQGQFHYRNLAEPVLEMDDETFEFLKEACPYMMAQRHGDANSYLPYFPGYKYEFGKSTYRGEETGEGGYVDAIPGIYAMVALLDIASMHPHSAIAEVLFGPKFTRAFREIVEGRVSIKHEAWDEVDHMLDGKLRPYIDKVKNGEMTSGELANALKTAINSVYGLTSAKFENAFRDPRNIDNIVAKRGALFMINLKHEVTERGFTVAHIKTDSIKIPNATPEIIKFVIDYGRIYGYEFEHEATYERMCLVNDAVYIAKFATEQECINRYGYSPKDCIKHGGEWTATGKQFAVPYVFKTLFSKEPIEFDDLCETKSVQTSLYLDMNESLRDVTKLEDERDKLMKKISDPKHLDVGMMNECSRIEELTSIIDSSHSYRFIGKVGQFCPIKPGCGGGLLMRETKDTKTGAKGYASATGCKGYRWLESEFVRNNGDLDIIDRSYYNKLVDDAVDTISQYGDFEWFTSDVDYIEYPTDDNDLPWNDDILGIA